MSWEVGSKHNGRDSVDRPLCMHSMHRASRRKSLSRHKFAYITLFSAALLGVTSSQYTYLHTDELLRHGLQP